MLPLMRRYVDVLTLIAGYANPLRSKIPFLQSGVLALAPCSFLKRLLSWFCIFNSRRYTFATFFVGVKFVLWCFFGHSQLSRSFLGSQWLLLAAHGCSWLALAAPGPKMQFLHNDLHHEIAAFWKVWFSWFPLAPLAALDCPRLPQAPNAILT